MDIEGQATSANQALEDLQAAVQALQAPQKKGKKGGTDKEQESKIEDCDRLAQRVAYAIKSWELEVRTQPQEVKADHKARMQEVEEQLKKERTQIDWKRIDASAKANLLGGVAGAPSDPADPMTLEQCVAEADHTQDASKKAIERTEAMALQAEQIGVATLETMYAQEEQMNRIGNDMEDVKANIKRSKKLVGQIARSAASDRCIQMICALITISVMVMIVLAMTGNDGGQLNVPDEVKQT